MSATSQNYEIIHADIRDCTLNLGCIFITLRESCYTQLPRCDTVLHGFMLQIIYSTVFRVKRVNNLTVKQSHASHLIV